MPDWKHRESELADGKFRLEGYIGGSEGSAVFLTRFASDRAAIKLVAASKPDVEELLERWNRAATVQSPYLVTIFAVGTCVLGGMPLAYLVMEYAEENLAGVLSERPLTTDETRETFKPITEALAYLHGQGLVHGNLKLSNILAVGETVKISSEAVSAGDPAADIQSLGVTLVQALTRQAPILGQSDQNIVDQLAFPYRELAQNCLHPDPRLRWSAAKIGAWLQSVEQPGTADIVPTAPVTKPAAGKPRGWNYAAVTVVVLGATLAGGLVMSRMAAPTRSANGNLIRPAPSSVPSGSSSTGQTAPSKVIPPGQTETRVQSPGSIPASDDEVRRRVLPDIPDKARNTVHGRATVVVRIEVDPDGNVVHATLAPGGSPYFGRLALEAAKHWQFAPAKSAGSRDWILRFGIMRTGTQVTPLRVASE